MAIIGESLEREIQDSRPSEAGGGFLISICISKTRKRTRKVRKQFRFGQIYS